MSVPFSCLHTITTQVFVIWAVVLAFIDASGHLYLWTLGVLMWLIKCLFRRCSSSTEWSQSLQL